MMENKEEKTDGEKEATLTQNPKNQVGSVDEESLDLQCVWGWLLLGDQDLPLEPAEEHEAAVNKEDVNGDTSDTHPGTSGSVFNKESSAQGPSDTEGHSSSNEPSEDHIANGGGGEACPTLDQSKLNAECSLNVDNTTDEGEEMGYDIFVQSVLSCLAEFGDPMNGSNGGELGQSATLSSDFFNRESGQPSLIQNSTPNAESPPETNIPGVDDFHGQSNPKDGMLSSVTVSEDSVEEAGQSKPPGLDSSGTGEAQLTPRTDNDETIPTIEESHGLNDLSHIDASFDSDVDENPSEDRGSQIGHGLEKCHPHLEPASGTAPVIPGLRTAETEAKEPQQMNQSDLDGTGPNAWARLVGSGWCEERSSANIIHIPHNQLDMSSNVNAPDPPANCLGLPYHHKFPSLPQSLQKEIWKQGKESNIQLPVPRNLRGCYWLAKSAQTFELGETGYSYEGGIRENKMHGHGRLIIDDRQFIDGNWSMNHLVELRFCQLTLPNNQTVFIVRRLRYYLLSIDEIDFVATVIIHSFDELDLTLSTSSFKKSLLEKITVENILADEFIRERQVSLNRFESTLRRIVGEDADPIIRATVLILLGKSMKNSRFALTDLLHDSTTPSDLRVATNGLINSESGYLNSPSYFFNTPHKSAPLDMKGIASKIYKDSIMSHRQVIVSRCPDALLRLASEIQKMDDEIIVYITKADIAVFDHIVSQPCFEPYKGFFENLVDRFCLAVLKIRPHIPPSEVMPLLPAVYGFLVKSFWEIILEIIEATEGYKPEDMLTFESGTWKLAADIKLLEEEKDEPENHGIFKFFKSSKKKSSLQQRSLVTQYKTLFQMLKIFTPENCIGSRKCESKSFFVLDQSLSWWQKGLQKLGKSVGLAKRLENWSPERLAWLDLLDLTLHNVLKDETKHQILLEPYTSLLEGHISFLEKSATDNHELFRVMTHNIIKFITSTVPYFRDSRGKPGVDVDILVQQIWTFSAASQDMERDHLAISSARDLVAEYNRYLSLRLFIDIEPAPGYFSSHISDMMKTFMRIVAVSLKKPVPTSVLVSYLRSLNDFLDDFKNIDFLAIWYVKSMFYDPEVMEKIENKMVDSVHCSYRVRDVENYVGMFQLLRHQPPDHCIIKIVTKLIECVETCLGKQWVSDQLPVAQLESASVLLDAIRRSFMYLKEQPDYVDFEAFKKESVDPFVRLVTECASTDDLKKRANIVKESFWYLRKMDEMSIDQALSMFKNANSCPDSDKILACYNLYVEHYEKYVAEYSCSISNGKSHLEGLDAVVEILDLQAEPFHYSEWTEEFKTGQIPVILAGLSAIWSILVSQDISSTGKFLNPHCIQIICVLRLLGVDSTEGVANHLAQVLTGQGKSVILALLSSTLALTGHQVRVVCYSEYLSSRDQEDFEELFDIFQITDEIYYGTFSDMANSLLEPTCNGVRSSLREVVRANVLHHTDRSSMGPSTTESDETVLLIDEVDVFFTRDFYGNKYVGVVCLEFRGLEAVQEKIWTLASSEINSKQIPQLCWKFIADEVAARNPKMLKFEAFLNTPGTFSLLVEHDGELVVKQYSNKSLFDEHLQMMASDARAVVRSTDKSWARSYFQLNSEGIICLKGTNNIYRSRNISGYMNIFNYFRLKVSNYDSKQYQNYGYLLLQSGYVSYARLPSQYSLILGVSGTATNLGKYEQSGLESYGINKISILPSFYGDSNLKFSQEKDFHYFNDVQGWLKRIYNQANQMVLSHRAVLIFFETDDKMDVFTEEYKGKFDRMNEITANTAASERDVYVEEAGLSGAVTLATREMGRGVDYKSSLSVEKNGGVHVIQTFYSTDVKEEVQIKGRTARKDNRGSYEMIICKDHLVEKSIITKEDDTIHSYTSSEDIRKRLSDELGKTVTEKIEKSERDHVTTMKYFGLM